VCSFFGWRLTCGLEVTMLAPMYEKSSASIILSYKVRIPVYCAASTLEFSNCHYYVGQEMCTPYGKQEVVLIRTTCDVILSRSPRAL